MRVLLLVPLLAACAGSSSLVRPNVGKEKFYEVTTPHVALITDMNDDDAETFGESLEELWVSLADNYDLVAPGQPRPTQRFRAIVLDSCEDFKVFRPHEQTAAFVFGSRDYQNQPIIVGCRNGRDNPRRVFLHELAHSFNHHFFARLPPWLEEGLAQYYETLETRAGKATIGRMPLIALAHRRDVRSGSILVGDMSGRLPTFPELMAMTPADFYGRAAGGGPAQHYAGAWAAVHMLNVDQAMQDRFVLYLSRLSAGQPLETAWNAVYGDLRPEQLVTEYDGYIDRAEVMWKTDYPRPEADRPKVRRLRAGEIHAVWLHLMLATRRDMGVTPAEAQVEAMAKADPTWPGVFFWRAIVADAYGASADVDGYLRRAADADPADRVSRLALLRRAVAQEGTDHLPALEADVRLLEKGGASGLELATAAVYWTRRGSADHALPLAGRAVSLDRGCAFCFEAVAMTVAALGKPGQAATYQQRAIDLIERQEGGADSSDARKRLQTYLDQASRGRP